MYSKYCDLRDSNGLRDSQVASATGIPRSTFSDWKSGRSAPKIDKLQKIADYFNVPLGYFYGEEENAEASCQEAINALNSYDLIRTGLAEYFEGIEFTDKEISMLIKQAKLIVESRD